MSDPLPTDLILGDCPTERQCRDCETNLKHEDKWYQNAVELEGVSDWEQPDNQGKYTRFCTGCLVEREEQAHDGALTHNMMNADWSRTRL